jgi:hypothetical protein
VNWWKFDYETAALYKFSAKFGMCTSNMCIPMCTWRTLILFITYLEQKCIVFTVSFFYKSLGYDMRKEN